MVINKVLSVNTKMLRFDLIFIRQLRRAKKL
jgi:hypothetical protein